MEPRNGGRWIGAEWENDLGEKFNAKKFLVRLLVHNDHPLVPSSPFVSTCLSTTTSDAPSSLSPAANPHSFYSQQLLSFFLKAAMKYSLIVAVLAAASVSAHELHPVHNARHHHLAQRQDSSPTSPSSTSTSSSPDDSSSDSSSSSSVTSIPSNPTSGTGTQGPPSIITGAPGAIPIDEITAGMPTPTSDSPSTTYPAGARPTWSGAPPLPSPCMLCTSHCRLLRPYASI